MYSSTLSLTSALDWGGWVVNVTSRPLYPQKRPGTRWMGGPQRKSGRVRKMSPPIGIRYPDRPARYRLSYPGPQPACPILNSFVAGFMAYNTKTAILYCKVWTCVLGSFLPSFFTYLPLSLSLSLFLIFMDTCIVIWISRNTTIHGSMNIKFINTKQATEIHAYKNTKRKLYKTNAAIWFNKTCRDIELTPNYINIKINEHCNVLVWTMYNIYEILYLIVVCKQEAANTAPDDERCAARNMLSLQ
jgi:hypothetical protein